jgi:hypothetical protein
MESLEVPRVYVSFDAFERDERQRLGLPELPAAELAIVHVPKKARAALQPASRVTPASLREEGVLEIGCAPGTSVLFVQTKKKLHLLHASSLPDRQLDDYAVMLAVNWIEDHGLPSCKVAQNLGVNETTLRKALAEAGYARISPAQQQGLVRARAARKFGNRRGRLARVSASSPA